MRSQHDGRVTPRPRRRSRLAPILLGCLFATTLVSPSGAHATVEPASSPLPTIEAGATQPIAPTSGAGSTNDRHAAWRVNHGGSGDNAWYAFEPIRPRPAKAPVVIMTHGYFEFGGYEQMYELIRHTVLRGSIVIYPRYQTSSSSPCPGPLAIRPCITSASTGIRDALRFLKHSKGHVRPDLSRTSYFGFSFGGILTANMAHEHKALGLPKPRAIFLDDPTDGGLAGTGEPALSSSLSGIPSSTLVECHIGSEGAVALTDDPAHTSCNTIMPRLTHIPQRNKSIVMTYPDDHGQPALSSAHGVCAGGRGEADAYDWNFCWKSWDVLRYTAGLTAADRPDLSRTLRNRVTLGSWSDKTPVVPPRIQSTAPLLP